MSYLTSRTRIRLVIYTVKFLVKRPLQFPSAAFRLLKAVYAYYRNKDTAVGDMDYDLRISKCCWCPSHKFNVSDLSCRECGCFIPLKALLPREQCPYLYWPILVKDPADINRVRSIAEIEKIARTRREQDG